MTRGGVPQQLGANGLPRKGASTAEPIRRPPGEMGLACSRGIRPAAPSGELSPSRTEEHRLRLRQLPTHRCERQPDGSSSPPSLVDLCVPVVCAHLEDYPSLALPAELARRVMDHLVSRLWLDLDALAALKLCSIFALDLPACAAVSAEWLPHITAHKGLARLDLSRAPRLTDTAVSHLAELTALQDLRLAHCVQLTDAALSSLGALTALRALSLDGVTNLTGKGLAHLRGLPELRCLSLAGCAGIDADALSPLRDCPKLAYLALTKCARIDDGAFEHLRRMGEPRTPRLSLTMRHF